MGKSVKRLSFVCSLTLLVSGVSGLLSCKGPESALADLAPVVAVAWQAADSVAVTASWASTDTRADSFDWNAGDDAGTWTVSGITGVVSVAFMAPASVASSFFCVEAVEVATGRRSQPACVPFDPAPILPPTNVEIRIAGSAPFGLVGVPSADSGLVVQALTVKVGPDPWTGIGPLSSLSAILEPLDGSSGDRPGIPIQDGLGFAWLDAPAAGRVGIRSTDGSLYVMSYNKGA